MNNELYHHGIKKQRWGFRRFQNPDGSLTELGKERYGRYENNDHKVGKDTYKRADSSRLSDDELKARIERIKLEDEYRKLLPDERTRKQIFMQDVLAPAAVEYGKKQVGKVLDKAGDFASEWVSKKLSSKLGTNVDVKKVIDSSKFTLDDVKNLSTSEIEERNKRLLAENTYKKRLAGDTSVNKENNQNNQNNQSSKSQKNSDDNSKNNSKKNSNDTPSVVNNIYVNGNDNKPQKQEVSNAKAIKMEKRERESESQKQEPVKHIPMPENAKMPSAPVYRNKDEGSNSKESSIYTGTEKRLAGYHDYNKAQYNVPPQKVDPRTIDRASKTVKKYSDSEYAPTRQETAAAVSRGEDHVSRIRKIVSEKNGNKTKWYREA